RHVEIRISLPQAAIIDKTINTLSKWKQARGRILRLSKSRRLSSPNSTESCSTSPPAKEAATVVPNSSSLPVEIYEQILATVGYDIALLPPQLDRLKLPSHFLSYFQFVDFHVRARNQTLRNCRLVCTAWNEIASKYLNTYLVIRNTAWKDKNI